MFGIGVFRISVEQMLILVIHYAVGILKICVQLVKICPVARYLVHFGHYRHHHIKTVGPPPVVIVRGCHFIFHYFAGTANTFVVGQIPIKIGICLETDLPVSEKHVVRSLAVIVFPRIPVVGCGAFPIIMLCPLFGISEPFRIACELICLHVAGMIGSHMPEWSRLRIVFPLPFVIDFRNRFSYFERFPGCVGSCGQCA